MLIRSQDKMCLVDMHNRVLYIEPLNKTEYLVCAANGGAYSELGIYSDRKKTIRVLNMIQEAYANYEFSHASVAGLTSGIGFIRVYASEEPDGVDEIVKQFKHNAVFQMPADEEVPE